MTPYGRSHEDSPAEARTDRHICSSSSSSKCNTQVCISRPPSSRDAKAGTHSKANSNGKYPVETGSSRAAIQLHENSNSSISSGQDSSKNNTVAAAAMPIWLLRRPPEGRLGSLKAAAEPVAATTRKQQQQFSSSSTKLTATDAAKNY